MKSFVKYCYFYLFVCYFDHGFIGILQPECTPDCHCQPEEILKIDKKGQEQSCITGVLILIHHRNSL